MDVSQSSNYPGMFRIARSQTGVSQIATAPGGGNSVTSRFQSNYSHIIASAASQQQVKQAAAAEGPAFFFRNAFVVSVDSVPDFIAWEVVESGGGRLRPSEWVSSLAVEFPNPQTLSSVQQDRSKELLPLLALPRLRRVRLLFPAPAKGCTVGIYVQASAWAIFQLLPRFDLRLVEGGRQDRTGYLKPPTPADAAARTEADRLWRGYRGPSSWIQSALDEMGWKHDSPYEEIACRLDWRDKAEKQRLEMLSATDVEMIDAG